MSKEAKRSKSSRSKSVFNNGPQSVQRFRLTRTGTINSSGAGLLSLTTELQVDPSGMTEYSDISDLYGEIRVIAARVTLTPVLVANAAGNNVTTWRSVPIAYDPSITSQAINTVAGVYSTAGAKAWFTGSVEPKTFVANVPVMSWASTATPAPGPYAGCYGAFVMYRPGFSNSDVILDYYLEVEYEVRGRR